MVSFGEIYQNYGLLVIIDIMENGQKNFTNQSEVSPENTVSIKKVDTFFNEAFLKLHVDGKITLSEDRKEIKSIEDEGLKEFSEKYGPRWPFLFLVVSHPEIQKDWKPDSFNSVNNTYPRIFAHRQFSKETPELFKYQENHAGIAIDDISVKSLPDTLDENMFIRNRLTEGNIKHEFILKDIPKHKILDLRSFDLSIENLGANLGSEEKKCFIEKLRESQFDTDKVEKMKQLIQEDKALRDNVALLIVNDNSALVLDPDYLINIDLLKDKLELVNVGTSPVSEAVSKANEIFEQKTMPKDVDKYIVDILNLYKKLYFESLTKLQKEKLNPELIDFIEMRNGLVYDDIFNALYKKILVIKELPKEKLMPEHIDLLEKVEELYKEGVSLFEEIKKIHPFGYDEGKEPDEDHLNYYHMQSFKEPLNSLIAEMEKFNTNKS